MKIKYSILVLFGSDEVNKYNNNEFVSEDEFLNNFKYYSFDTKKELDAFIFGLEEANGWMDLIYFTGEKISKINSSNLIS